MIGSARLAESNLHPISPKAAAPQYQRPQPHNTKGHSPTIPTYEQKEENGKNSRRQKEIEQLTQRKNIDHALETLKSHTIEYTVSKIVLQLGTLIGELKSCSTAGF